MDASKFVIAVESEIYTEFRKADVSDLKEKFGEIESDVGSSDNP